jgi:hypothetical protein
MALGPDLPSFLYSGTQPLIGLRLLHPSKPILNAFFCSMTSLTLPNPMGNIIPFPLGLSFA